jgi:hypothetical protein
VLVVAEILHKFLYIVGLLVREEVALALETTVVNQEVSVSYHS